MPRPYAALLDSFPTTDRAAPAVVAVAAIGLAALAGLAIAVVGAPAVILCVALVACLFIVLDFRAGVVMLVVIMPISASRFFPHEMLGIKGLNPLNLLLGVTLASFAMRELARGGMKGFLPRPLLFLYIVPLVAAGLLGMQHVGEIAPALHELESIFFDTPGGYLRDLLLKPLFMVLFALLVAAAVERIRDPEKLLTPIVVSVWIMCFLVIFFVAKEAPSLSELASENFRQFFQPLGLHANDLGRLYMVAYAILLFTWAGTEKSTTKLVLVLSMGLTVLALVLTFSRGAFLGFALVNLFFLFTRRTAGSFLVAFAIVAALLVVMPDNVWERLGTAFSGDMGKSSAGRTDQIWEPLYPELLRSPIWGNGIGSIMWSDAMRGGRIFEVTHPHNAYLQMALDFGALGTIAILAFWLHAWRGFSRLAKDAALSPSLRGFFAGARAGLAGFFLAGVAGSSFAPVAEQSFLWLAIGMMYGLSRPWPRRVEEEAAA